MKIFDIILENGDVYRMQIGFNFYMYSIKKEYLYKGFKKLGKIVNVREVI